MINIKIDKIYQVGRFLILLKITKTKRFKIKETII